MFQRFIGILLLIIALGGIAFSIIGARMGHQLVDRVAASFAQTLAQTSDSLEIVSETLLLAKSSIEDVNTVVTTAETTADNLAETVSDTRPLLNQIAVVASDQVPNNLETIQEAFPSLEQVAGVIDRTLVTLNSFRIDEEIFGLNIEYDLGIDYEPEIPFDQSVRELSDGLEGIPESLRAMEAYITITSDNLETVSQDIRTLADDLETVNDRLTEFDPILDEYLMLITNINDSTRQMRAQIQEESERVKSGITFAMIWLALTQIAPLYLGWELITGRRGTPAIIAEA
ncbi:hypothetical protein [Candidatus Leptofilum sp.]|uniref:hypothetical protein n=1 Tax=Candidatus Leptofilum sp. TaxID=3241576 RepID=UPI003B5CCEE5